MLICMDHLSECGGKYLVMLEEQIQNSKNVSGEIRRPEDFLTYYILENREQIGVVEKILTRKCLDILCQNDNSVDYIKNV